MRKRVAHGLRRADEAVQHCLIEHHHDIRRIGPVQYRLPFEPCRYQRAYDIL